MTFPVELRLYKNGYLIREVIAEDEDDLYCTVEMDTGIGRFDAAGLYQQLMDRECDQVTGSFRLCNSYVKWGQMQQEVVIIRVRLSRIEK